MKIQKGQPAPPLTLYSSDKEKIALDDLKGQNVLLLFFPLAFTTVCTQELCSVRDNLSQYNQMNVRVFGISVDSPQTLNRFKQEQNLNFTLLSDFNKEASTAYGCLYEVFSLGMKGVSKRSAFLIDSKGIVQYAEVLENAGEVPDFEAIVEAIKGLNQPQPSKLPS